MVLPTFQDQPSLHGRVGSRASEEDRGSMHFVRTSRHSCSSNSWEMAPSERELRVSGFGRDVSAKQVASLNLPLTSTGEWEEDLIEVRKHPEIITWNDNHRKRSACWLQRALDWGGSTCLERHHWTIPVPAFCHKEKRFHSGKYGVSSAFQEFHLKWWRDISCHYNLADKSNIL